MYNDDVTRIPADEAELWKVLWEQFEYVRHVLWELDLETKEEALENGDDPGFRQGMGVIRYRDTGAELDQRDHYLVMGRELLPYIHQSLDDKKLTPEFVQQWGKIMFCHGYLASYVFDDTDDLALKRAGHITGRKRSKDAQRKWLAHIILPLMKSGMTRNRAEEWAAQRVEQILERGDFSPRFGKDWFRPILSRGGLAATYDFKHFAVKTMEKLVKEARDDIPPIPKIP